jgi:hypothetical protein
MSDIVLSLPPARYVENEMVKTVLYRMIIPTSRKSLRDGTTTPFDTRQGWVNVKPPTSLGLTPPMAAMSWISNQLLIRLPGLVSQARALREIGTNDSLRKALRSARDLLPLKCDEDERQFLKRLRLVDTDDPSLASIIPLSFGMPSRNIMVELRTALYYWKLRLLTTQLYLELQELACEENLIADRHVLLVENERMATHILQSLESTVANLMAQSMSDSLMSVWSVLRMSKVFCGKPVEVTREFILQRYECLEPDLLDVTAEELDTTCKMLAGGPLEGTLLTRTATWIL